MSLENEPVKEGGPAGLDDRTEPTSKHSQQQNKPSGEECKVLDLAKLYAAEGWSVIPIPYKEKAPKLKGWQNLRLTEETVAEHFNGRPQNVGVLLGEPSGGLVDADLDCAEAVRLAPDFLPPTGAIFGRKSTGAAHRGYVVPDLGRRVAYEDPDPPGGGGRSIILELRGTGHQ